MAVSGITKTRFTGLASGLDTDALIKSMMQIEQLKLDRQLRNRTTLEWKQEALNNVSADLKAFTSNFMSALSPNNMYTSNAYQSFNVNVTGTNKDAVTINASASAAAGSHKINQIIQLAETAKAESNSSDKNAGVSKNGTISDTNRVPLRELDLKNKLEFVDGKISFAINGSTFTFSEYDTLEHVMNTVNSDEKANVTMSYSRLSDKFTIESKETGSDQSLFISNILGNAIGENSAFGISSGIYKGEDAKVDIDGYIVTRSSNNFTIDGISYQLHETTEAGDPPIKFSLTQNTDAVYDKIKAFVDGYNELIQKLDNMLVEKKTSKEKSYTPLTEEEKASMTEEQIEQWETIAKKGLLQNDAAIQGLVDSLRSALYETVQDAGLSPADIGLKTGSYYDGKKGQIVIDEDKLRDAIANNPQKLTAIFTNQSESEDNATAFKEKGLLARIETLFNNYTKGSQATTLNSMDRRLTDMDKNITKMEDRMAELEEQYYQKFAAMETLLSKLQSQSDWLSGMVGSMGS